MILNWNKNNPEKVKESYRKHYWKHKDEISKEAKEKYWKNPEESRKKERDYYQKNSERILERTRIRGKMRRDAWDSLPENKKQTIINKLSKKFLSEEISPQTLKLVKERRKLRELNKIEEMIIIK